LAWSPAPGLRLSVAQAIARAEQREGDVHAFVTTDFERARLRPIRQGPLAGVPFSLKDVWDVAGLPTTSGADRFRRRVPLESGEVFRAFEAAGAVLLGKTNLSEFAMTPECVSRAGGRTLHPLDATRTPGGSSGGAAAAVADGMAAFDWGSDFGGSIRLPAAFCGVVGLRLSASRWPPSGHRPRGLPALRLNGMGPLAASVDDCRAILQAVEGRLALGVAPPAVTLATLVSYGPDAATRGEWPAFDDELARVVSSAGLVTERAALPAPLDVDGLFTRFLAVHFSGWLAGAERGLLRLHPDTAKVIAQLRLLQLRHLPRRRSIDDQVSRLRADVTALFARGAVLLTPTTTWSARRHGDVLRTRGLGAFVKLGNLVDATALSVPWGAFANGLPRGLQLLGPPGSELALLDLAQRLEAARR
jgi:Asp-tRNA(Asn)/Glu-tRNA(Gln) amidotransferase A subunit family amidase